MNRTAIIAVSFLVGAGVGVGGTVMVLKKKYEQLAQEEIDEMREYLTTKLGEMADGVEEQTEIEEQFVDVDIYDDKVVVRHDPNSHLVRSSLTESNQYEAAKKDYNLISTPAPKPKKKAKPKVEVVEEAVDPDPSKPYIINDIQYNEECPEFSKIGLFYYADGVLADEGENLVDDITGTIGAAAEEYLQHFGAAQLYVRNEPNAADYEIMVINQEFGSLYGMQQADPPRRRKSSEEQ